MSEKQLTSTAKKDNMELIALDIKAIVEIRDRMKWIYSTPLSCDINTIGECKASIDATREILGTDVEVLGETIADLKNLLGLNEGGQHD